MKYKLIEIETIEKSEFDGEVNDLSVEEDTSYVANGYVVHNSVCTTTANGAIGYPLASLIYDCNQIREYGDLETPAKIVADGGIREFADIIKALALGADYVMLGSIFNKAIESSARTFKLSTIGIGEEVSYDEAIDLFHKGEVLMKQYRGMSTKDIQREMGKTNLKTSEGIVRHNKVEYSLSGWIENFEHYLRSNMSYTGFRELDSFIGGPNFNLITEQAYKGFAK